MLLSHQTVSETKFTVGMVETLRYAEYNGSTCENESYTRVHVIIAHPWPPVRRRNSPNNMGLDLSDITLVELSRFWQSCRKGVQEGTLL
jgi:hypothetical protein